MDKLYNIFLKNLKVTKKQLKKFGYDSSQISQLKEEGLISRKGLRYYVASDKTKDAIEKKGVYLYNKGMYFFDEGNFAEAKICLEESSKYLPATANLYWSLLNIDVFYKQYYSALDRTDILYSITENKNDIRDLNFYLYLLGGLVGLNKERRDRIKDFNIYDWRLSSGDLGYSDYRIVNKIRIAAVNKKFFEALRIIKEELSEEERFVLDCRITKRLLFSLSLKQKN